MRKVTVKELYRNWESLLGQEVELSGWVKKLRDQKSFGFIELNDGSFFNGIQVVFNNEMENFEEVARLSIISTIRVVGKVVVSEGSGQKFEVKAETVEVIQKAD
ncbi:MAG: OB-fold nucleic acid binding domain-containing protein, partial [Fusobacteriaceae bacterium]